MTPQAPRVLLVLLIVCLGLMRSISPPDQFQHKVRQQRALHKEPQERTEHDGRRRMPAQGLLGGWRVAQSVGGGRARPNAPWLDAPARPRGPAPCFAGLSTTSAAEGPVETCGAPPSTPVWAVLGQRVAIPQPSVIAPSTDEPVHSLPRRSRRFRGTEHESSVIRPMHPHECGLDSPPCTLRWRTLRGRSLSGVTRARARG